MPPRCPRLRGHAEAAVDYTLLLVLVAVLVTVALLLLGHRLPA